MSSLILGVRIRHCETRAKNRRTMIGFVLLKLVVMQSRLTRAAFMTRMRSIGA